MGVIDLADINDVSFFAEQLGSRFRIEIGPEQFIDAELIEAQAIEHHGQPGRQAFSLLFKMGQDLPQSTYRIVHDAIGELHIFMCPVGPGTMETVFNQQ